MNRHSPLPCVIANENVEPRFRWIVCQLDILQDCVNLPMLETALNSLPSTIGETYALMLSDIKDRFKPASIKAFQWLALAMRPLDVEAFIDMLAIDLHSESKFDPTWRMPDPDDILRVCSSLITITFGQHRFRETRFVKLAHFSVKEYLLSDMILVGRASAYAVDYSRGHAAIAEACLHYLLIMFPDYVAQSTELVHFWPNPEEYPLGGYAVTSWWRHVKFAGEQAEPIFPLIFKLMQRRSYRNWFQAGHLAWPFDKKAIDSIALRFAAWAGWWHLMQHILEHGADANCRFFDSRTPSQVAIEGEDVKMVKILLEHGADTEAPASGRQALHHAARIGCDVIVDILLQYGAHIDATSSLNDQTFDTGKPFFLAKEPLYTIGSLDSRGPLVDGKGDYSYTPLAAASSSGHVSTVKLLLSHGANVNNQGRISLSRALHDAAYGCHREIVRLLIGAGADVNALDERDETMLYTACSNGWIQRAELLIDSGAHVNAIPESSRTPLKAASCGGHDSVVRLLIQKGAKTKTLNQKQEQEFNDGPTKAEIVEIMLREGQAQYEETWSCREALELACKGGDDSLIRLFISYRVNFNGPLESNSLEVAARFGHCSVVKLLLDAGAVVDGAGAPYPTPLESAVQGEHWAVVRQLLEAGASVCQEPIHEARLKVLREEVRRAKLC